MTMIGKTKPLTAEDAKDAEKEGRREKKNRITADQEKSKNLPLIHTDDTDLKEQDRVIARDRVIR
jgi:hypothetical protein